MIQRNSEYDDRPLAKIKRYWKLLLPVTWTLLAGACALPKEAGYPPPTLNDPSTAATVYYKASHNPTETQFAYLLMVDGQTVQELRESDDGSFKVDAGSHDFKITCHVVPNEKEFGLTPPRFSVVDGTSEISADLAAGDEMCLKVSKTLLSCAQLTDAPMSTCK